MRLREIQKNFENALLRPAWDCPAWDLPNVSEDFCNLFSDFSVPFSERLKIYHANVVGSAVKTLQSNFPLVQKLVGEDFFRSMASMYVIENPPKEGYLNLYGAGIYHFITHYNPAKHLPYLSDIARLEQAISKAYNAPDDTALDINRLNAVPHKELSDLIMKLRPSATLLQSSYPLEEIRALCKDETENIPDMSKTYDTMLLILRPDLDVTVISLAQAEFMILTDLQKGLSLGASLRPILKTAPHFDLVQFLTKHIELKTFSAFP